MLRSRLSIRNLQLELNNAKCEDINLSFKYRVGLSQVDFKKIVVMQEEKKPWIFMMSLDIYDLFGCNVQWSTTYVV